MFGRRPWAIAVCCAILLTACGERVPFFGDASGSQKPLPGADSIPANRSFDQADDIAVQPETGTKPQPIIVEGNRPAVPETQREPVAVRELDGGQVTLNFVKTSLPEVAKAILGDILGANYVIDPNVGGEVTLETSAPIPRDSLLPTFESILQINGAALVRDENLYKIVPSDQARRSVPPIITSPRGAFGVPGYRIQVVPLSYVSTGDMQTVLETVAPPGGILRADAARNILILAGSRQDMRSMLDVIDLFDVDWLHDKTFGIFPVEYADSATMISELEHVLGSELGADMTSVLRFVSIDRLNAVLAISPNKDYVDLVGEWISRLDRSWDQNDQRIFVYPVQNSKATDLAALINNLFGTSTSSSRTSGTETVAPRLQTTQVGTKSSDSSSTSSTTSSSQSTSSQTTSTAATGSSSDKSAGDRFGGSSSGGSGVSISGFDGLRVIADETNNSLVVLATPAQYRTIETTLRRLDVIPLQVLIEATIAEVTLNDDLRYGVQWFFEVGGTHQLNLSTIADSASPGLSSSGFSYFFTTGTGDISAALDLLSEISDVKVISSPHLMVLSNQTASLQVGDEVPVITRTSTSTTTTDSPIVSEVEYRDTGVILTVTPRVNPGGLVTLEIEQEASTVAETTTGATDSPTIQQRLISSTVVVQSGESIALGGLIRDNVTKTRNGIPILKDIPVLGALFGRTADLQGRTELIIVLTPRVVSSSPEAVQVTRELKARMKGLQKWDRLSF